MRASRRAVVAASWLALVGAGSSQAEGGPEGVDVILQLYDITYIEAERRMPDIFAAGYEGVWWPPNGIASLGSIGYDPFDRFNLGSPSSPTAFGTEAGFRAAVDHFHRANVNMYLDIVLNHNGARSARDSAGAIAEGAWPGFFLPPDDVSLGFKPSGGIDQNWFDFNNASGFSTDAPGFNESINADLVGLIDFRHSSNYQMVRHPVDDTLPEFDFMTDFEGDRGDGGLAFDSEGEPFADARRIPEGTVFNKPTPANARLYPDLDLEPMIIFNPDTIDPTTGSVRNTGGTFTIYPFNTEDPSAGDPIMENTTGLLLRYTQWLLDEFRIDGFRMDAAKHVPEFFWDTFWDAHVYNRWHKPDGTMGTPFSFGESTLGNFELIRDYVRIDGFAFRDTLDLSGAGTIRSVIGGRGDGFASALDDQLLDAQDEGIAGGGFSVVNGSSGVKHIHSHDNGTFGDGGGGPASRPDFPSISSISPYAHAFLLFQPGPRIVYHNARQFHTVFENRFWVREGNSLALGYGGITDDGGGNLRIVEDDRFTKMVRLANRYGRGEYVRRWEDLAGEGFNSDVFIYERSNNVIVAVNDSYVNNEHHTRTISTDFTPGTRLHELTGNALPGDEVLIVGGGGSLTVRVPSNVRNSVRDDSGYVIYGPATPSGTLELVTDTPIEVIPADPPFVGTPTHDTAVYDRRITPVSIVRDDTFTVRLTTTKTDPLDPNWDDAAALRFNRGFIDLNKNGEVDIPSGNGDLSGYEDFADMVEPIFGTDRAEGLYEQAIDAGDLREGMNYLSVIAFRHRSGDADPLFGEWREAIYLDTRPPTIEVNLPELEAGTTSADIVITNPDYTAGEVYVFVNLSPELDDPPLLPSRRALKIDRNVFEETITGLEDGLNEIAIVAVESFDGYDIGESIQRFEVVVGEVAEPCPGDLNGDRVVNATDFFGVIQFFGTGTTVSQGNFDGDEATDADDFFLVIQFFGADCN